MGTIKAIAGEIAGKNYQAGETLGTAHDEQPRCTMEFVEGRKREEKKKEWERNLSRRGGNG